MFDNVNQTYNFTTLNDAYFFVIKFRPDTSFPVTYTNIQLEEGT